MEILPQHRTHNTKKGSGNPEPMQKGNKPVLSLTLIVGNTLRFRCLGVLGRKCKNDY